MPVVRTDRHTALHSKVLVSTGMDQHVTASFLVTRRKAGGDVWPGGERKEESLLEEESEQKSRTESQMSQQ